MNGRLMPKWSLWYDSNGNKFVNKASVMAKMEEDRRKMKKEEVEVENKKEEKVGVRAAKNCVKNKGRTKEDTKNEARADMKRLEGKESRRDPELDRKSMGEGAEAVINENETSVMVRGDEKNKQGHNLKEDQVKRKSKSYTISN